MSDQQKGRALLSGNTASQIAAKKKNALRQAINAQLKITISRNLTEDERHNAGIVLGILIALDRVEDAMAQGDYFTGEERLNTDPLLNNPS